VFDGLEARQIGSDSEIIFIAVPTSIPSISVKSTPQVRHRALRRSSFSTEDIAAFCSLG
jgi:hypothetical protein